MNEDEERFLEELETAINPFIRGELTTDEYVSLSQSFHNHDNPAGTSGLQSANDSVNSENDPPSKKRCGDSEASNRFSEPVTNLEDWTKPYIPKNTAKSTKWAQKNFLAWLKARKEPDTPSSDILETCDDPNALSECLCKFILETRTAKGDHYAPRTLNMILAGLHRYVQDKNPNKAQMNFMQKDNPAFKSLRCTCDRLYRQLRSKGIGLNPKQAQIITTEEENKLWESGVLGTDSPRALLNAVFFYNGRNFLLRGGEEHRFLRLSQFQRYSNPDRYEYTESGSKNNSGGLEDIQAQRRNKIVPIYKNPSAGNRCHVTLLDLYISKIPPESMQHDFFYLKPKKNFEDGVWYANQVLGKNELARMVPKMFQEASMTKKATNHSLRATGTTEMYRCGVPENVIKERTGHKSLDGLRTYERTTLEQQKAVSKILTDCNRPSSGSFNMIMEKEERRSTVNDSQNVPPEQREIRAAPKNLFNFQRCQVTFIQHSTNSESFDLNHFDEFMSKHLDSLPF